MESLRTLAIQLQNEVTEMCTFAGEPAELYSGKCSVHDLRGVVHDMYAKSLQPLLFYCCIQITKLL